MHVSPGADEGACRIRLRAQAEIGMANEPLTQWSCLGKNEHLRNAQKYR
jgi:hypothetical protein